jgi:hypothetical protein
VAAQIVARSSADAFSEIAVLERALENLPTVVLVHVFLSFLTSGWARGPIGAVATLRGMRPGQLWTAADRVLVARIREAIHTLLSDGPHRAAATSIGTRLRRQDGASAAVAEIEAVLTARPQELRNRRGQEEPSSGGESSTPT